MKFLIDLLIRALVLLLTAYIVPGFRIDSYTTAIMVTIVLAILNVLVKPLLILLTLPVTILSLGLFLFVINAILILIASNLIGGFQVESFGTAILASLVITVLSSILNILIRWTKTSWLSLLSLLLGKLFDFKKLFGAVLDKAIGDSLLISLLYTLAFAIFIYAFQPFSTKILGLNASQISLIFTAVGIMGLVTQVVIIPKIAKKYGERKTLSGALLISVITFSVMFLTRNTIIFVLTVMINALANGLVMPMIATLLSKEVDEKSQGSIMGLNTSYQSIGFIFGPIIGGALATVLIPLPFLFGSLIILYCFVLSRKILRMHLHKQSAF